jgi:hypothetical protein
VATHGQLASSCLLFASTSPSLVRPADQPLFLGHGHSLATPVSLQPLVGRGSGFQQYTKGSAVGVKHSSDCSREGRDAALPRKIAILIAILIDV